MKIVVYTKSVYGRTLMYVAGPPAHAIMELTGSKTITHCHIKALEALGHTVLVFDSESSAIAALSK